MISYYLLDRRFFLRLYLLTVLKEKKFAVSDKKAKNVTNPRGSVDRPIVSCFAIIESFSTKELSTGSSRPKTWDKSAHEYPTFDI